jgi:hypothetical protein
MENILPDAVGIDTIAVPFERDICCVGLILFVGKEGGTDTVSSAIVAIENMR